MDEHDLIEALEGRAADVTVGPAPVDLMTRSAGRTRRSRAGAAGLAAAAVLAVVAVGAVQLLDERGDEGPDRAVEPAAVDVPPDGTTYVGLGRAAIAVPSAWERDDTECNGTPNRSTWTVNIDQVVCDMFTPFPQDTDIVTVSGQPYDTAGWTPVEVDGEDALRSPDEEARQAVADGGATIYGASVFLPDEGVTFRVQSTVSADSVADLLDGIVLLDDHVGVPSPYGPGTVAGQRMDEGLLAALDEVGLVAEVRPMMNKAGFSAGYVGLVEPAPGTVVEPGSTVVVEVRD